MADSDLTQMAATIRRLEASNDRAVRDAAEFRKKLEVLEGENNKLARQVQAAAPSVKTIDDVPGYRIPKWYTISVDITSGSTARTYGNVTIDPEGPFVITQITPTFLVVDSTVPNFNGRNFPCSAAASIYNQAGGISPATLLVNIAEIPEFSFEIEIGGSGRQWTNQAIPSAAFYGYTQPLITGVAGWVDPTDTVKLYVTPTVAAPRTGVVQFTMCGYQILNPNIRISKFLGFAS